MKATDGQVRPLGTQSILSPHVRDCGENPAHKTPVPVDEDGPLFGTENICRALAVRSGRRDAVVLRGDAGARVVANAEELVLHVMSAEVSLILAKLTSTPAPEKVAIGIERSLDWQASVVTENSGELPAAKRLVHKVARVGQEPFATTERKSDHPVGIDDVPGIEIRTAVVCFGSQRVDDKRRGEARRVLQT